MVWASYSESFVKEGKVRALKYAHVSRCVWVAALKRWTVCKSILWKLIRTMFSSVKFRCAILGECEWVGEREREWMSEWVSQRTSASTWSSGLAWRSTKITCHSELSRAEQSRAELSWAETKKTYCTDCTNSVPTSNWCDAIQTKKLSTTSWYNKFNFKKSTRELKLSWTHLQTNENHYLWIFNVFFCFFKKILLLIHDRVDK